MKRILHDDRHDDDGKNYLAPVSESKEPSYMIIIMRMM